MHALNPFHFIEIIADNRDWNPYSLSFPPPGEGYRVVCANADGEDIVVDGAGG